MVLGLGSQSTLDRICFDSHCFYNMYNTFQLNIKEQEAASLFKLEHKGHGPNFEYTFLPTKTGITVKIKCLGCGKIKNITY